MENKTKETIKRVQNPIFWVNNVIAIVVPILGYYGLTFKDITSWGIFWDTFLKAISNPYVVITSLSLIWNNIINPCTKGILD